MFQVESVVNQPVTRTAALISLVCALWSLIYGGTYILRFGTMRGMEKASMWAEVRCTALYIKEMMIDSSFYRKPKRLKLRSSGMSGSSLRSLLFG